jgi:hypothetical protein
VCAVPLRRYPTTDAGGIVRTLDYDDLSMPARTRSQGVPMAKKSRKKKARKKSAANHGKRPNS